jgi:hypothetical protein
MAWQAACTAMAWEGIRVYAMRVTVSPTPEGGTDIVVSADLGALGHPRAEEAMSGFMGRFRESLAILESGRPLPPEPPPLPSRG